ncbi:MAG: POTRA domain-containing protein [Bryobacteraceae bacterium]
MPGVRLRLAVILGFAVLAVSLRASSGQYEGRPIARIVLDPAQQPLSSQALLGMLPLKPGQPLTALAVRDAIQKLYSTGEYADISVDATLEQGQVVLRFITKPAYFIGHIAVQGVPEPPSRGQLVTATKLQLGTEYSGSDLKQAEESLADVVKRNGFYNARIVHRIDRDPKTQQVTLNFLINPGPRARFDGITVTGNPERSVESIVHSTGWKPFHGLLRWRPVTENRLQSGLEGIRGWYQRNNHLLAKTTLSKLDYFAAKNTVTPAVDIQAGPLVKVKVEGVKISGGQVRSLLPIYQERSVDKDLLVEGKRDLTEFMQSKGYFDTDVDFTTAKDKDGQELVDYTVDRGARHRLVSLEISGNKYFDRATLRERMYLMPSTFLRFRHGRFSKAYLNRDVNTIRDLYRSNGFQNVEVNTREIDDYQGKKFDIAIFIDIKEGPQWFVASLQLEGVPPQERDYLRSILHSTQGQPYSELNVGTDRDTTLDFYYNNGYPKAKFDFAANPAEEPDRMDLVFRIDPGERVFVRDVLVSGLEATDPDLVTQRISLTKGDPLSQDKITESQKRLYDLGIFAKVNTALQNPEGDEPTKYVLYSMEEARRYSFNAGFGAEIARIGGGTTSLDAPAGATGFSPRVSLGITRLNFLGLGHTIGLQTRVSTLEQRALFTYLAPQFEGNANLNLQLAGLFDISKDVRTFSSRREEGSIQLGRKLSKAKTVQFRYTFRKVNIIGTPLVTPELIPLLSQPTLVGLLGATFIQDRRDDPTDSHRGIYNTVDLAFASKAFGSQTGFGRVVARNSTYHRLTKSLVLARSTYFGSIQRYAGLADIPLAERFFSGGSSSHRGFPDNQAGPRDFTTGFPLGGRALLINSVELRFPLIGDNIGGVVFNDMGNVYSNLSNISLRWHQRNLQDFDYGVQAFGYGIRYKTPIGPVRVDLSLSPNSPRFFGFQGTREELIFGGGRQVVQRINVFQFHFSLGQAF